MSIFGTSLTFAIAQDSTQAKRERHRHQYSQHYINKHLRTCLLGWCRQVGSLQRNKITGQESVLSDRALLSLPAVGQNLATHSNLPHPSGRTCFSIHLHSQPDGCGVHIAP